MSPLEDNEEDLQEMAERNRTWGWEWRRVFMTGRIRSFCWGKRKQFADGKVSLAYSSFFSYRKGEGGSQHGDLKVAGRFRGVPDILPDVFVYGNL